MSRMSPVALIAIFAIAFFAVSNADAEQTIDVLCDIKGQETQTLTGYGLVIGLNGTGDPSSMASTQRSYALLTQALGAPIGDLSRELKDMKNVAAVIVTVTIPKTGAREGQLLDCKVSAPAAKSLQGGRLFLTPVVGPIPEPQPTVYGFVEGNITVDDPQNPNTGTIHKGCRLTEDFFNPFVKDGKITLLMKEPFAGLANANAVASAINASPLKTESQGQDLARAIDGVNVEVEIPSQYHEYAVEFAAELAAVKVLGYKSRPRVTINERAGVIAVGEGVEIGPVAVHLNDIVVRADPALGAGFVGVDPASPENPKLEALVAALNAVSVTDQEIIEIIKQINKNEKLYGELIIE